MIPQSFNVLKCKRRQCSRCAFVVVFLIACLANSSKAEPWPGWRGPRGDGTSAEKNVPTQWNGKTGKNIVWKVEIPGRGHASPIVWGDRLFMVTCLQTDQHRVLLCLDRKTGKILWQRTVIKAPLERKHHLNSFASSTPVTDGRLVYTTFLKPDGKEHRTGKRYQSRSPGEMIVAAYDFDGNQKWLVRPGRFASVHGYCASPVLFQDKVIVNGDHDGDAYLVALDRKTGKTLWKTRRENKTRSYSTPIIRQIGDRTQMILSGSKCVASFDPNNGKRHWIVDGPTEQFVASVVTNEKLVFVTAGFPELHMMAIRPDGRGNVTDTHIVWRTRKACSYVPSPIAVGDYFLVVSDHGIASCFEAATGKRLWMKRLGRHYRPSLITAEGLVYFLADDGTMTIVRPGATLDIVAENPLGETCYASPALSQGQLFIRAEKHLYAIGAADSKR